MVFVVVALVLVVHVTGLIAVVLVVVALVLGVLVAVVVVFVIVALVICVHVTRLVTVVFVVVAFVLVVTAVCHEKPLTFSARRAGLSTVGPTELLIPEVNFRSHLRDCQFN